MNPAKILVLDTNPPSEKGFLPCTVVRDLTYVPDALNNSDPLVFVLLHPGETRSGKEALSELKALSEDTSLWEASSASHSNRLIHTLLNAELYPFDSPEATTMLRHLQSLVGPFHVMMAISISEEEKDPASSPATLSLPAEPDKALGLVLSLDRNRWHFFNTTPESLSSFLKLLPLLSGLGKRFLFSGTNDVLVHMHKTLVPSSGVTSLNPNENLLGQFRKNGSHGLIVVDKPEKASELEKEGIPWFDPVSEIGVPQNPGSILVAQSDVAALLQETRRRDWIEKNMQFLLFWGPQWDERTVSSLLDLSLYRILGTAGKGKGLILQGSIHPSTPPIPIILAHEEVGFTLWELYHKLSPAKRIRPSWDDYFLGIARAVAERATCDRGRSGCVIVRDKAILVTGYVGSPTGLPHCDDVGHQMKKMIHEDGRITQHCVRTVHAEQNAICQAAKYGISLNGGTLYCKMTPCRTCAMLIINCGIRRVVCEYRYHAGGESEELFRLAGIELEFKHSEVLPYSDQ